MEVQILARLLCGTAPGFKWWFWWGWVALCGFGFNIFKMKDEVQNWREDRKQEFEWHMKQSLKAYKKRE